MVDGAPLIGPMLIMRLHPIEKHKPENRLCRDVPIRARPGFYFDRQRCQERFAATTAYAAGACGLCGDFYDAGLWR